MMLSDRKRAILKLIISEYISSAIPVGSQTIVQKYQLPVSPATVRNEMAELEEEGYITHPHTSAGRIPSDRGYRYYVETLMEDVELTPAEKQMISHQFHQVEVQIEEWTRLAASALARSVQNAAVVTLPRPVQCRLKYLQFVSIQDTSALLVLVMMDATIRQQIVSFSEIITQDELNTLSNKLNSLYDGLTAQEIENKVEGLTELEQAVAVNLAKTLHSADRQAFEELTVDGLRHLFKQPEFTNFQRMSGIVEILEDTTLLSAILASSLEGGGVRILIGSENTQDVLHDFSLIMGQYGAPGVSNGAIGVVGPTRMNYGRTISTVRFLAELMSALASELSGGHPPSSGLH